MKKTIVLYLTTLFLLSCNTEKSTYLIPQKGLFIHPDNPSYWYYNGEQTLLLGGSNNDNLFQSPDFVQQLDLLQKAGGNYVRNTMSSRDSGDVWPFARLEDGKYDLNEYNSEYWKRFENFLSETESRNIIVQIEIWATFDFYRENWLMNPFNPKNNINYDHAWSKLDTIVNSHPIYTQNNFFRSVPSQMALHRPLYYQQKFVDKLLEISLKYNHVLYCMDNETSVNSDWAKFWASYIKKMAQLQFKVIYCTEMWDPHELDHAFHYETFDNPQIFDFVDISQNNHNESDQHWENGLKQFERLRKLDTMRPVNNVKVYGNDGGRHKTTDNAIESFIQNVLMGCASTRFHRPTSGQGINQMAQNVINSMHFIEQNTDFYNGYPSNEILGLREEGEAFCRSFSNEVVIYFPDGGEVQLLNQNIQGRSIQWINPIEAQFNEPQTITLTDNILTTPGEGHWVCLIK